MEMKASTKYARMSAKKVREVARQIQGRGAVQALQMLRFIPRKSARLLAKTLKSAIANAENNNNMSSDDLIIKEAVANDGPAFKRSQPAPRGSAHPIRKRTTHIDIILVAKDK